MWRSVDSHPSLQIFFHVTVLLGVTIGMGSLWAFTPYLVMIFFLPILLYGCLIDLHCHLPIRHSLWSPRVLITSSFFFSSYGVPVYKIKSFWHQIALPKRTFPHPRHAYCCLKSISKPIDLLFHFSRDGNERHEGSGNLSSSLLTSASLSPIDKYCFFQGDNLFTIVNCYLPRSFYHSA